jgi:ABC-type uncharacterized transport system permease subunit
MQPGAVAGTGICLVIGAAISFLVSSLKRWAFVKSHVKLVAFFVSVLVGIAIVFLGAILHPYLTVQLDYTDLMQCIFVQFTAAIATHEVVVEPISRNLVTGPATSV